jgi:RimJ/RimL family protein N-acetyltransferase
MQATGAAAPWAGYLAIDPARRLVIGTCAFKGPPDADRAVEVAYFTFAGHEGRGYATAMARTLRDQAVADGTVRVVRAHTLPERNASARILEKLGFQHMGEVHDPEDGLIWRWDWAVPGS